MLEYLFADGVHAHFGTTTDDFDLAGRSAHEQILLLIFAGPHRPPS